MGLTYQQLNRDKDGAARNGQRPKMAIPDESWDKNGASKINESVKMDTPNDTHTKSPKGKMCWEQTNPRTRMARVKIRNP